MEQKFTNRGVSSLFLVVVISINFLACSDDNEARRFGETIIDGTVVVEDSTASATTEYRSIISVVIDRLLNLSKPAHAQTSGNILVLAFQDGTEVDSDTADDQGNFQVNVPRGGDVTLRFEAPGPTATTLITVTPDSIVTLDVALLLDPAEVEINTFDIAGGPVRTRELEKFVFNEERADLTIDGGGGDCIRATGSSNVNIDVNDLSVINCKNGIIGEDFADVSLEAVAIPTLSIDAGDNGVHARDDSSVRLTGVDIFITAGIDGILATGTSRVVIDPSGNCIIEGGDDAVDERDLAAVNTSNCTLT